VLVVASTRVEAACVDPVTLAHSTVSITRYFDDSEKEMRSGVLSVSGTGWFLSSTLMVTIEHVVMAMNLSDQTWKPVEMWTGQTKQSIPVRVQRLVGAHADKIALVELQTAFPEAPGFQLRSEPLVPEESIASLAYPGDRMRVAGGRFVHYGTGDRFAGMALLELYAGDDRLLRPEVTCRALSLLQRCLHILAVDLGWTETSAAKISA
jgi:hypothetical protein